MSAVAKKVDVVVDGLSAAEAEFLASYQGSIGRPRPTLTVVKAEVAPEQQPEVLAPAFATVDDMIADYLVRSEQVRQSMTAGKRFAAGD